MSVFEEYREKHRPVLLVDARDFIAWRTKKGRLAWLGQFSNNTRDNDTPPEILARPAHEQFVDKVSANEWDYPELWLDHESMWKIGVANWVALDIQEPLVFTLAAGFVDKNAEDFLLSIDFTKTAMSHGFQVLARSAADPTVIEGYRTVEVSVVSKKRAANRLTSFVVLDENAAQKSRGTEMAITEEKRESFAAAVGASSDALTPIEEANKDHATKAVTGELEFKAASATEAVDEQVDEKAVESEPVEEAVTASEDAASKTATVVANVDVSEGVIDAVAKALEALHERLAALEGAVASVKTIAARVDALENRKPVETVAKSGSTINAVLSRIIEGSAGAKSVVGQEEAIVKDTDALSEAMPTETAGEQSENGLFFSNWMSS